MTFISKVSSPPNQGFLSSPVEEERSGLQLLEVRDLQKSYSGKRVLCGLSFHVNRGEVVGLLGPNGAGKTTAFYMTMGLLKADSGQVIFKGQNITSWSVDRRAKMGMGYLAQEPSIFRSLTVEENILCILQTLPLAKKERFERLGALLEELHLTPLAKRKAITLSGGERRRLEITRALVTHPELLLLDEPFANVDPLTVAELKKMIRHLVEKGISILITDHNARELFSIVDRSYLVRDGVVLTSGTSQDLVQNESARQTYFGEDFQL